MSIRAQSVLFDLDGTLVDTAPDLVAALNKVLVAHGRPALSVEQGRPYVSRGAMGLLYRGFGLQTDHPEYPVYVEELLGHYRSALSVQSVLFGGMEAVLARLEADERVWGVVTNKAANLTEPLLKEMGLSERLAVLVCGDTLAEKKPSPKPLLHACDLANITPEQTIYVGDDPRDVEAANAAGMISVAVRYGYYDDSENIEDWGADIIIDHPKALLTLLN
ncbi:MAG: phosphoglycolate phosphatase [Arenicellales bacterium]